MPYHGGGTTGAPPLHPPMHGLHLIADLHDCRGEAPLDDADALRALCLDAGMDDHLAKPLSRDALAAMVSKWVHRG